MSYFSFYFKCIHKFFWIGIITKKSFITKNFYKIYYWNFLHYIPHCFMLQYPPFKRDFLSMHFDYNQRKFFWFLYIKFTFEFATWSELISNNSPRELLYIIRNKKKRKIKKKLEVHKTLNQFFSFSILFLLNPLIFSSSHLDFYFLLPKKKFKDKLI